MGTWTEYKLSQILDLIGGGTPKTSIASYWDGDIPWLSVVDFNNGRKYVVDTEKKITDEGLRNSSTKMLNAGDIIISARGTVGVLAVLGRPMAFNQSCYGIRAKNDIVTQDYLYYLLNHCVRDLHQISHGGVFDTITRETFDNIDVSIPDSTTEQQAIASVLSSLDDKIDLLHRQNKTLEQLAETLFRQWFVEEAEEGWEVGTIDDATDVKGGGTPSTSNPAFWDGDIHWTSPRDLSNNKTLFMFDTERKITSAGLDQISSGLFPAGTLLLSSRAPIGYLTITEIPVAINQGYIAMLCNKGFSSYYMYLWTKHYMNIIIGAANGSVFLEISKSVFKTLDFVIPPQAKVEAFDKLIGPEFRKIKANTIQIHTLIQLRDALLPKLMSGEVRVKI